VRGFGEAGADVKVLHHVSLPVTDLGRSRRFYREVLGLEEIARAPLPVPGAWFRLGDCELHLVAGEAAAVRGSTGTDPRQLHSAAVRVASYRARWSACGPTATARTPRRATPGACWRCPARWSATRSSTCSTPTGT
jgi:catechol 2,3-dioxygenase-like lactoylglutathione lyase family enzyme